MNTSTLVQKLWNYCNVLRDDYKGERCRATLRQDGHISCELYASPSAAAAKAIVGRAANGWRFWQYKKGAQWVRLSDLRK